MPHVCRLLALQLLVSGGVLRPAGDIFGGRACLEQVIQVLVRRGIVLVVAAMALELV